MINLQRSTVGASLPLIFTNFKVQLVKDNGTKDNDTKDYDLADIDFNVDDIANAIDKLCPLAYTGVVPLQRSFSWRIGTIHSTVV